VAVLAHFRRFCVELMAVLPSLEFAAMRVEVSHPDSGSGVGGACGVRGASDSACGL